MLRVCWGAVKDREELLVGPHISLLSKSANCFQLFLAAFTRFPLGHHCTLPRPKISVPSNVSPLRISMVMEFSLLSLVSSTVLGRCATTFVKTNLRRLRLSCFGIPSMVLRYESGAQWVVALLPEQLDECLMKTFSA